MKKNLLPLIVASVILFIVGIAATKSAKTALEFDAVTHQTAQYVDFLPGNLTVNGSAPVAMSNISALNAQFASYQTALGFTPVSISQYYSALAQFASYQPSLGFTPASASALSAINAQFASYQPSLGFTPAVASDLSALRSQLASYEPVLGFVPAAASSVASDLSAIRSQFASYQTSLGFTPASTAAFTTSAAGLVPASGSGSSSKVLYGNGSWAEPPGSTGGEANTASNLGAGAGVYASKSGVDLRFKSLVAGANIAISSYSDSLEISGSAAYSLPVATASILGGVKQGSGISIDGSGVISNSYSYTLPTATASVLGGVKVGSGLSITDGVLAATTGGSGGGSLGAAESLSISSATITPGGTTNTVIASSTLGTSTSIYGSGITVNSNNITFNAMPGGGLNISYGSVGSPATGWTESPGGTFTPSGSVIIRLNNSTATEDVTVTSIVTTVATPEAVIHFTPAKTLTYSTGSTYQTVVNTVTNIATTNLTDGSLLMLYPATGETIKLATGGNISTAVSALPLTGTILQRKGSTWQVVSAGTSSGSGGGSDTVTALGTSGTQTINRATSGRFTIAPASAATLADSNFTDMQEAILDIYNGMDYVSYPSTWYWKGAVPTLEAYGINRIKLKSTTWNSAVRIIAESDFDYKYPNGNDSYTKLLVNFEFDTFTDESTSAHTLTNSSVTRSTSVKKFGRGSGTFTGTNYVSAPSSSDFVFANGDFTLEAWVYRTSNSANVIMHRISNGASGGFALGVLTNGNVYVLIGTQYNWEINTTSTGNGNVPLNTWTHVALVRSGNDFCVYVGGTQYSVATSSISIWDTGAPLEIGVYSDHTSGWIGNIDCVRISKGIARYTSAFTPSPIPFQ